MLIRLIPQWTSFSVEPLTYFVGDSFRSRISIWQLVEIPYGKKIIFGIVAEILDISDEIKDFFTNFETEKNQTFENSEKTFSIKIPRKFARFSENNLGENREEIEIKSILSIVSEKPILSLYQITMIVRIAMKYILPIHKVLQIFLSEPILRRLHKYDFPLENEKIFENFSQKNVKNWQENNPLMSEEGNFWKNFEEKNIDFSLSESEKQENKILYKNLQNWEKNIFEIKTENFWKDLENKEFWFLQNEKNLQKSENEENQEIFENSKILQNFPENDTKSEIEKNSEKLYIFPRNAENHNWEINVIETEFSEKKFSENAETEKKLQNFPENNEVEEKKSKNKNQIIKNFSKNPTFDFYISKNEIISPEKILPFFVPNLVIILPDDILLERFQKFFEENENIWREKIAFYPAETTETRRAQAFIDIYNKKSEIIIWSRRLLQYNLSAYDEIWYLEDGFSSDYYHYPVRIAYTDFLAHIVDSEDFSVKIFSSIPRLKTLSQFHFFRLHHF